MGSLFGEQSEVPDLEASADGGEKSGEVQHVELDSPSYGKTLEGEFFES